MMQVVYALFRNRLHAVWSANTFTGVAHHAPSKERFSLRPQEPVVAQRTVDEETRDARAKRTLQVHRRDGLPLGQLAREIAERVRHGARASLGGHGVIEHRLLVRRQVVHRDVAKDLVPRPPGADVRVHLHDLEDGAERHRADHGDVQGGVYVDGVIVDERADLTL